MSAQYIKLGRRGWNVLIYYNVDRDDFVEIRDALKLLDCPTLDINTAFKVLTDKNTGFTFSNSYYKMSIVCIGKASNVELYISTAIHEAKHVQSHICSHYLIKEDSEKAAYLIGYLVSRMYRFLVKLAKRYV